MPPTSRGKEGKAFKVVKPKKNTKRTTISSRNHRWQSFNERISSLKIDPVRRKRHVDAQEEKTEESHTHLGTALEEWRDTNLSQTFTTFAKEISPLCDNLAMVLYNENKIMDLLANYIEKGDGLAMEPLLSLLSHFAHDLDARFEKHFQRAVATVTAVAAKHADFAVIEWSFNCLAWLFKYLSRLLVPDLRPLFDLLSPYFGKETQRPFIVRFTAEAMSFLVRKAATIYEKDSKPLDLIMEHMLKDCSAEADRSTRQLYEQGIMTLLTEAIKGIQGSIHNSGVPVLQSLFKYAGRLAQESQAMESIVTGILTSLIHHCISDAFKPVLDSTILYIENEDNTSTSAGIRLCASLLFTIVSVRKGTRVLDWKRAMKVVQNLVSRCGQLQGDDQAARHAVLGLLAISMQTATIDAVLATRQTLENLRSGVWSQYFPRFCDMFCRLGTERFHDFVLPHFQRFVLDHADAGDDALYALIPRVADGKRDFKLKCSPAMIKSLLDDLSIIKNGSGQDEASEELGHAHMKLTALPFLVATEKDLKNVQSDLLDIVQKVLKVKSEPRSPLRDFALGSALHTLLDISDSTSVETDLWIALCDASKNFGTLPQFWTNFLRYLKLTQPSNLEGPHITVLEDSLISCLANPSHSIRQDALDILQQVYQLRGSDVPNLLSVAITIESVPISLETSRTISMNIRRLVPEYVNLKKDDLMQKAIPTYCFGLLHLRLSQAWDDATAALSGISSTKAGEEVMIALAQTWLEGRNEPTAVETETPLIFDMNSDGFKVFSDFECPNLAKMSAISNQVFEAPSSGLPSSAEKLALDHKRVPMIADTARSQALRVLHKVPQIAEKRSRLLVPVLLKWAGSPAESDGDGASNTERWARKDQKAMLAIFAQFVNPKVLYKSSEVYDALLSLCANGDVEIQRSALKAILAWKEPAITRYEEHLMNILDEARFREELSVFLRDDPDEDEDAIRPEDHTQLMPVLLRLLYGRAISGGKEGQGGRRKAIFVALSRFGERTLEQFLEIALRGSSSELKDLDGSNVQEPTTPLRQQFGMLNMVNDMLQVLGAELEPFAGKLMNGILSCAVSASQKLEKTDQEKDVSLLRSVRQAAMQCMVKVYSSMAASELERCGVIIVKELIRPRLDAFASENAQSVSAALRLFAAWTMQSTTAELFSGDGGIMLERTADLLRGEHTKGEVRLFVLQEILDKLFQDHVPESIIAPHVSSFVRAIGSVIEQQPSKEILDACVKSFSHLAGRITSSDEAADVTKTCTDLLVKPGKAVSPWTKTGLLRTLLPLIQRFDVSRKEQLYSALSALFSRLQDVESRLLLSQVLIALVRDDVSLTEAAKICEDINAMGSKLDEPDHDRREHAFAWIYESAQKLALKQWLPIIHNSLYYMRDGEDRVNRTSASRALQLFVDATANASGDASWTTVLDEAVLSAIERGMRDSSELVRAEYLLVLGHAVEKLPSWSRVAGLQTLAVGGDDEASFFSNALHIQQHRRLRALRRLADEASSVGSNNASRVFLPLLEHFVFDQIEGDSGRTLADQAVQTIGALAKTLNRSSFRATFQRYTGYLKSKPELEKIVLRLLGAMVDGMQDSKSTDDRSVRIIIDDYLPPLLEYLHQKDESTVDRRMPVAVTIVKLLLALPETEFTARLPAVLTDVSHVLRSRAQEARDQTRKAIMAISSLVGPRYFSFILKELRSALKRGYQLHVLSFTVHSLLVESSFEPGDLDECLPELMMVIMDDIFGVTGQEKDAEEYKSGMKEVKSSKSFDTMELLARVTPINKLGELVRPIRSFLSEKLDLKMVKKIDDLLTRLRKGLDQNPASESRDMLAFCWQIVSQVYAEEAATPASDVKVDERRKRYLVQPEEPKKSKTKGATTSYRFKLISFALNLLRKVVRRHEDLQTPQNMAGFLPMAGDALIQGQEEVKLSALRLLSTIMRVSLPQLEANAPVYVKEAVAMIKGAPNMTTDAVKASLELITSVLREKRTVIVKEKDMAIILKRIKTDIDEPDRQGIIYKFLRAVLGRKIVITEVYETMDEVGKAMVTSPDRTIRESARGAYLQFVMEYPQGKDRWQKQTSFLVSNLQYEHAAGRQSVMEFLHNMLGKVGEDVLNEICPRIFVSLLPVLIGDSDHSCRDMAKLLVGKLFERAGDEQLKQFLNMMETWLKKEKKSSIKAGALQCWAILLRARQLPQKQLEGLRNKLEDVISDAAEDETVAEPQLIYDALQASIVLVETAPAVGLARSSANLWKAIQQLPSSDDARIQESVAVLLGLFFTDVASTSSKTADGLAGLPLRGSGGLDIGAEDMRRLCAVNLRALRAVSLGTSESLTAQIVRNLIFLGRCFAASEMPWSEGSEDKDEESEQEDDDDEETTAADNTQNASALAHLLRRLSSMLLSDKFSIISRTATLSAIAALINQLSTIPNLQTVLRPLYALTDPSVPKPPGELHKAIEDKAAETLELIQKKLGSEAYVAALAVTRTQAKERRDERRRKRRIEAVSEPERWARDKKRKYEGKKVKAKVKGAEARGRRRGW